MFDVVKKEQKMNFEQPIDICKQKLIQHVNSSLLVVIGFPNFWKIVIHQWWNAIVFESTLRHYLNDEYQK